MRFPWVNVTLLVLLLLQLVTGYFGFTSGRENEAWLLWLHGIGAYGIVVLLLWKGAIIWDVLGRGKRWSWARAGFVTLLALLLLVLVLGVSWTFGGLQYLLGFSVVSLHIYVAVPLILLLAFHVWRMRWILRIDAARDKRAFLRTGLLGLVGWGLWALSGRAKKERRFTGSYEIGSFSGQFPRVSWINDDPAPVDVAQWRLAVSGAVQTPITFTYGQLMDLADEERTATVDCTGGWYSTQAWRGVPLRRLLQRAGLAEGARSVTIRAITGYNRRFTLDEAGRYLLATHVAGRPLSHGHGFPLRLIAPDKRGFEWVKWIIRIEVNVTRALWQPPLPLQ